MAPEVSVVVESYTHGEGSALERLTLALEAAMRLAEEHGDGEVLLTDSSGDTAVADLLVRRFPTVRRIDATRLDYDGAKMKAAREAAGEYILYLDGDCVPGPGWLGHHLAALRSGDAEATGGFTRYDGGFLGAIYSIMDFGFLLPARARTLGCYAFNNSGFRRELLAAAPVPEGPMRCRCYAHAQLLDRRGTPVRMVPEATVRHERQPFFRERYRQGFDIVAACWVDPRAPEGRFASLGVLGAPLVYARTVRLDWTRLFHGRHDLGLTRVQAAVGAVLLPLFRLVDLAGVARALAPGGRTSHVGFEPIAE